MTKDLGVRRGLQVENYVFVVQDNLFKDDHDDGSTFAMNSGSEM